MTRLNKGLQVKIFLVDGIRTAEIGNWSGHALAGPKSSRLELSEYKETSRTGVYLLAGMDKNSAPVKVYIGESDNIGKRLSLHANDPSKDFWDQTYLFTSKDLNLTKTHTRYLESRLMVLVSNAGCAVLVNSTSPDRSVLPITEISDMEHFLQQAQILLPLLGLDILKPTPLPHAPCSTLCQVWH